MLGSVDRGHARALVQALAARDGPAVLAAVDGLRRLGLSAAGTLEEIGRLLQQMAVAQAVPGALDALDPENADALALAPLLAADETQLLYSMALHGREELGLMSDEYGALTMVLLRFLAFPAQGDGVPAAPPLVVPRESREPRAAPLRASPPPAITLPAGADARPKPIVAPPTAASPQRSASAGRRCRSPSRRRRQPPGRRPLPALPMPNSARAGTASSAPVRPGHAHRAGARTGDCRAACAPSTTAPRRHAGSSWSSARSLRSAPLARQARGRDRC